MKLTAMQISILCAEFGFCRGGNPTREVILEDHKGILMVKDEYKIVGISSSTNDLIPLSKHINFEENN